MNMTLWVLLCFVLGLVFGSFANVVIWRLPRGESISNPPSRCPRCETPIAWRDNVPVVSWLALRGKCRACGKPIPVRYPLVEAGSAALWVLAAVMFGVSLRAVFGIAFYYILLVLSAIDIDHKRLPNPLVGGLGVIGIVGIALGAVSGAGAVPLIDVGGRPWVTALLGAVVSAGTASLIAGAYSLARKVDGFGMGDVKLLAVIGLFLGPFGVMVLFLASLVGAVFGIAAALRSDEGMLAKVPFGPFLAVSAVAVSVFGPQMWHWYSAMIGL